jgi:alkylation response protein AidB-like acyl-CoA dehydrogenase
MDFEITDEQEELRSAVRAVLERECPVSLVRERVERGSEPSQPWRSAVELGWPGIAIPERFGGLGLGFVELALALEEHGRFLAPGPFLPTLSQFAPALLEAGSDAQQQRWLAAVAAGQCSGTLAVAAQAGLGAAPDAGLRARRDAGDWILDGSRHHVVEGDAVDEVVVAAAVEEGDGVGLFLVPRAALKTRRANALDASRPLVELELDGVRVGPERILGQPGRSAPALERTLQVSCVALAVETTGTCQAIFDQTLAYARQREQFGRPIGSFQAVQHKFADMFGALEKARAAAYFAAMTLAEDDPRRALAASMAKVAAGDAQRLLAKEGIQTHGGIGFTWEQDLHLFVKRAKTGEALFGTSRQHRRRIADLLWREP